MSEPTHDQAYRDHVLRLNQSLGTEKGSHLAVGGEFDAVGKLEYHLLRSLGLRSGHFVVDVGCGSGRLAHQLAPFKDIGYLGTDIVPELLEFAKSLTKRNDWTFALQREATRIPCPDRAADFITFFSVLTHTKHEDSFRYFREAARCLKAEGRIIVSFLEFRIKWHWETFVATMNDGAPGHWNQFMDRDAINAWAEHSGLVVESFFDGDQPHIPIPEKIVWENGMRMEGSGNLGQSVAVLRKS